MKPVVMNRLPECPADPGAPPEAPVRPADPGAPPEAPVRLDGPGVTQGGKSPRNALSSAVEGLDAAPGGHGGVRREARRVLARVSTDLTADVDVGVDVDVDLPGEQVPDVVCRQAPGAELGSSEREDVDDRARFSRSGLVEVGARLGALEVLVGDREVDLSLIVVEYESCVSGSVEC
jgi:hypothetical protein